MSFDLVRFTIRCSQASTLSFFNEKDTKGFMNSISRTSHFLIDAEEYSVSYKSILENSFLSNLRSLLTIMICY